MGTVKSGVSRSSVSWSCRSATRPIVRASVAAAGVEGALIWDANLGFGACAAQEFRLVDDRDAERLGLLELGPRDRKSTRLNSSHGYISYAVFCLKKKKKKKKRIEITQIIDKEDNSSYNLYEEMQESCA